MHYRPRSLRNDFRDIGIGEPLELFAQVTEQAKAAGDATVQIKLETASDKAFSDAKAIFLSEPMPIASLNAGKRIAAKVPQSSLKFLRLQYIVGDGPLTAGKFTSGIILNVDAHPVYEMPLAIGWKIGIAHDLPVVQETDLRNQGKFFAEVHEDALDYLTMLIQKSLGFLSLCLRKPSFISDHFDAKGNKISNLGKPVKDGDAVDLGTMNDRISAIDRRSLRVADKDIPALPNAANRANKLLSFDNNGNPVVIVPESGSAADVLAELGSPILGAEIHWLQ